MRKQDHLLQLIATLTPNEKRYFKLFTNIYPGDKRYLKLFDALENKPHYDAGILMKELDLDSKKLRDDKYYLNQMLLRSLGNNEEISTEMVVNRVTQETYSLLERRLFEYAFEHNEKNIERAREFELYHALPNLISIKQRCLSGLQRGDEIPALSQELGAYNIIADELFEISQLRYSITALERLRKTDEMLRLFKHPLLKKKVKDLKSLKAQVAWFDIMTRYVMLSDTPVAFAKMMKSEVELYEKDDRIQVIDPLSYLHSYAKVARAELKCGNTEASLAWLAKFAALLEKPPHHVSGEKVKAMKCYCNYSMAFTLRLALRFNEALPYAHKSCKELGEGYPYEEYSYTFEYALALFYTAHFKECADELDFLLQLNTEMRSDLQLLVRPLMILVQYELGNNAIIPYLIKSAKAWLKRNDNSDAETDVFFRFMHALAKANRTEKYGILAEFKTAVDENKVGYLGGSNIELSRWIERQMTKNKRAVAG